MNKIDSEIFRSFKLYMSAIVIMPCNTTYK